ncbi:MAG: carboxymuconolactone decarboxylase family protein [Acidobacteriaceae bacterium]|nr:carboxymuconolactone decarboxylase family protein [Acidobacteriaceae bacterium]
MRARSPLCAFRLCAVLRLRHFFSKQSHALRSAFLAPRDRSLVTVSALIASGYVAQIPYHLNRAVDKGLTRQQASEVVTHLGRLWPLAARIFCAACGQRDISKTRSERS